jgi:hypothetical protein
MAIDADESNEVKADITPLIDLVFLLLIFFILTTTFVELDKKVDHLLPTTKGENTAPSIIDPPEDLVLAVHPAGPAGASAAQLARHWSTGGSGVVLRHGGRTVPLPATADGEAILDTVETFVADILTAREQTGLPRAEQRPVVVRCFSELEWRYALAVYDGVRSYEQDIGASTVSDARPVTLAPPPRRGPVAPDTTRELSELVAAH